MFKVLFQYPGVLLERTQICFESDTYFTHSIFYKFMSLPVMLEALHLQNKMSFRADIGYFKIHYFSDFT